MPFSIDTLVQYREAELDCHIGARGYLYYFQDAATHHFRGFGKGNDVIPYEYGLGWIITKYRLKVLERAPMNAQLHIETWLEPQKSPVRLRRSLRISSDGRDFALGEMELCLADTKANRVARLSEIGFDASVEEHVEVETPSVRRLSFDEDNSFEYAYSYTVRYCDLDNNGHMNNLHYVDLVLNAFDSSFHTEHPVCEVDLEYVDQCREGDVIDVLTRIEQGKALVIAKHQSGSVALKAQLGF